MNKEREIQKINNKILSCRKCNLYKNGKAVPGEGNPSTKVMFIGEAPGIEESKTGRPFVGRAGKFLDKMLDSFNIKRKDIFITSVLRHYPGRRAPKREEIEACKPYLYEFIRIINPRIVVLLGNVALKTLIDEKLTISKVHGKIIKRNRIYIPTYHPSAAMRFPKVKEKTMKDFEKIKRFISF